MLQKPLNRVMGTVFDMGRNIFFFFMKLVVILKSSYNPGVRNFFSVKGHIINILAL